MQKKINLSRMFLADNNLLQISIIRLSCDWLRRVVNLLAVVVVLLYAGHAQATPGSEWSREHIEVINFEQLEPWLHKQNDTIYVVNFWATWCAPCVRELPYFERINETYASDMVKVLLVSLDFPGQINSRVLPFLERHNVHSEVVLLDAPDANRWIPLVDESWTGAIPATVIYHGSKRYFFERELKYEELEGIIIPLVEGRLTNN